MPPLAEVQALVKDAVVNGDMRWLSSLLVSPGDPGKRLTVHSRHYTASLVTTLVERFPATIWLLGSEPVVEAARAFIRDQPPSMPCLAEYGDRFPAFLAAMHEQVPYAGQFAMLEWHVGRLSLAVDEPALDDLSMLSPDHIADTTLRLQSGVKYVQCDWPLDELLSAY